MGEFRMPSLGADMEAGTLVAWRVKPGDRVKRGDIVADVETQKGVIEVEIWESGVVERLVVPEGEKVPVGTVLAIVDGAKVGPGLKASALPAPPPSAPQPPVTPRPAVVPTPAAGVAPERRPRASPAAKKRAEALGIDLASVAGSGPSGAIGVEDVERAARDRAAGAPAAAPVPAASPMRAAIAAAMSRSKREIPHYYLSTRVDLTRSLQWLEAENAKRPVAERLLHVVLLLKAVALALRKAPELNGFYVDGAFRPASAAHVGVAISLRGGGLIAPALHDVGDKPLPQLMVELSDLTLRARAGSLRSSELADPTITVTNLAEPGVEAIFGVIHPPQVAIVGFGQVIPSPAVEGERIVARRLVTATLSADHRVSDGHLGGRFLAELDRLLQHPEEL